MPYQLRDRKEPQAGRQDQERTSEMVDNELEPSNRQLQNSKVIQLKRGPNSSPQEVFSNRISKTSRSKVRKTRKTIGARGSESLLKYAIKKLDNVLQQQRSHQLLFGSILKSQKDDHRNLVFEVFLSDKNPFQGGIEIESDYEDVRSRVRCIIETKLKDLEGTLRNVVSGLVEDISRDERLLSNK